MSEKLSGDKTLRQYLEKVSIRNYEEVFLQDTLPQVLKPSPGRLLGALVVLLGVVFNFYSVAATVVHDLPTQHNLFQLYSSGALLDKRAECKGKIQAQREAAKEQCKAEGKKTCRFKDKHFPECDHIQEQSEDLLTSMLYWSEFLIVSSCAFGVVWNLWALQKTVPTVDGESPIEDFMEDTTHMKDWMDVSQGIGYLLDLQSASAIKRLSLFQTLGGTISNHHYLREDKLKWQKNGAPLEPLDYGYLIVAGVSELALGLFKLSFAIFAFYMKLVDVADVVSMDFHAWSTGDCMMFMQFAYQVSNLILLELHKKRALLLFVFTGGDSILQASENKALHEFQALIVKRSFFAFGALKGFAVSLNVSSTDLHSLFMQEKAVALKQESLKQE